MTSTSLPTTNDAARTALTKVEFEEAVREALQPLRAVAMRLARNRPDADDLMQEALYRAWRGLATFRRGTRFVPWVVRILYNVFINRVRRDKRAPLVLDPETLVPRERPPAQPQLREQHDLRELSEHLDDRVKEAVEGLPERYRAPFVLFALGGLSYQEIADTLEIPIGTVMSRLHRARAQLREALRGYARSMGVPAAAA